MQSIYLRVALGILQVLIFMFFVLLGCLFMRPDEVSIGYAFLLSASLIFPAIRECLMDTPLKSWLVTIAVIFMLLALGIGSTVYKNPTLYKWPASEQSSNP